MSEELQYVGLVLEDQLLDHLATPEGATAVWKERLNPDVIPDSEEGVRETLKFVIEYMDEYRVPPTPAVISEEMGYEDFNVPETPVEYVIEKLRERFRKKNLRQIVTKMGRLSTDPQEAMRFGIDQLTELRLATDTVGDTRSSDDLARVIDDYRHRIQTVGSGIPFGYHLVDEHLGGLRIGEVSVLLARPKRYKSWQLVKSAVAAFLSGKKVFFETMELSEADMQARFKCMLSEISWKSFQRGLLSAADLQHMDDIAREATMECDGAAKFHRAKPGERNVHSIVAQALEFEADVIYIDQLSWFDGAKDEGNWRIIGQIMEQLKDASQNFPIYMAAQYNRMAAQEEGLADVSNAALSGFIEQTADHLLGLYASRDMMENKLLHLGVVESRTFEPITWELKVELTERSNFKNLGVHE